MKKSELLNALQQEYQSWEAFLDRIGRARMEQPGVNGDWSMKDVVAHLTGWNHWVLLRLRAAARNELEPSPPWPVHLQGDDEINEWIYDSNRERSADEVMEDTRQVFRELFTVVEGLPEDVRIEQVHQSGRVYHLVWVNDQRFQPGEFFDHFHDDHKPDVQAWLARIENE